MDGGLVASIVVGLAAAWLAFVVLLLLVRPRDVRLRELVAVVPDLLRLVRDLLLDRGLPRRVRAALVVLLVWLVSPIDLIPEFVPVLGPLDDVIVAVLVLRYVRRRIGTEEMRSHWSGSDASFRLLLRVLGPG